MSTAVVAGGAALLLDMEPDLSPAQVKVLMQLGARFLPSAGLIGAGTGSVDFAQSVKIGSEGLVQNLLGAVTNLLGLSSGASFVDRGTLVDRLYDRTGLRLLGLLDIGALLGGADYAEPGILTLLGENNSLGDTAPNHIVWGNVADWSTSYYIAWGTPIQEPSSGQHIVWGNMDGGDHIVWGTAVVENDGR
jgi:hypothetical protein